MVQALLKGSKMQTRRVVKPQPTGDIESIRLAITGRSLDYMCPYGRVGDQLWVKETWCTIKSLNHVKPSNLNDDCIIEFRADSHFVHGVSDTSQKWRSSLFMPRRFSRITLQITNIRIEQLNECSESDAIAEGVSANLIIRLPTKQEVCKTAKEYYHDLWESIHGTGSWNLNPWVWVVEFSYVK